jgi:hypothetical protein
VCVCVCVCVCVHLISMANIQTSKHPNIKPKNSAAALTDSSCRAGIFFAKNKTEQKYSLNLLFYAHYMMANNNKRRVSGNNSMPGFAIVKSRNKRKETLDPFEWRDRDGNVRVSILHIVLSSCLLPGA